MGQVSPKNDANLYKDFKSSSGVGLRIVFSSVVLRADIATGEEGSERDQNEVEGGAGPVAPNPRLQHERPRGDREAAAGVGTQPDRVPAAGAGAARGGRQRY